VGALSAAFEGKPLGGPVPCAPDRPAKFALPKGVESGEITVLADGVKLVNHVFPLPMDANTNLYPKVRAALGGKYFDEKHGNGTKYRGALKHYGEGTVDRGRLLLRDGQTQAAIACLRAATTNAPADGEGWHLLGAALLGTGDAKGAREALDKALAAGKPYAGARYYLALVNLREDKHVEAYNELATLVREQPLHWEGLLLCAWAGAQIPEVRREAVALAQRLVDEDPADPRACRILADCYRICAEAEAKGLEQLTVEPGSKRRLEEMEKARGGEYVPAVPVGGPGKEGE
jgi:tetratricopeptide (TPR) repeat protein